MWWSEGLSKSPNPLKECSAEHDELPCVVCILLSPLPLAQVCVHSRVWPCSGKDLAPYRLVLPPKTSAQQHILGLLTGLDKRSVICD